MMPEQEIVIVQSEIISHVAANKNDFSITAKQIASQRKLLFFNKEYYQEIHSISNFDTSMIPSRLKRRMSLLTQMIVSCGHSCLGSFDCNRENLGIVVGTGWGELETTQKLLFSVIENNAHVSPTQFHNSVHNTAAGYLGIILEVNGPTLTISQENVSFEAALEAASLLLECKQVDVALAGAGDTYFNFSVLPQKETNYPSVFSGGSTFFLLHHRTNKEQVAIRVLLSQCISSCTEFAIYMKKLLITVAKNIDVLWCRGVEWERILKYKENAQTVIVNNHPPQYPAVGGEDILAIHQMIESGIFPDLDEDRYQQQYCSDKSASLKTVLYITASTNNTYKSFLLYR